MIIRTQAAPESVADKPVLPADRQTPVKAARFANRPVIDGQLDEEVWSQAGVLKDFYQTEPGDNVRPPHPTEVRIGYDAKFLYLGIHAGDQQGQVRSTVAKRDDLSGNDYVAVWLDTFNDRRRAYVLLFNPLGVQGDGVFTEGQGIDFSVDVVMQSQGRLTEAGYTIEVAIPFTSLRYEAGPGKLWGVHVLRLVRHLDEWDTWMPLRRESRDFRTATFTQFLEQEGHVTGIEDVGRERTIELIPTLVVSETGERRPAAINQLFPDAGHLVNRPPHFDPGLTAKLSLSSGVTLDATFNPDFAQVEADQLVITANQRFPIFFEEKRPFFLEGIEIFQTPIRAVHTRTIIDPDVAVKLTGKRGPNTFGLLMARDNAPGNFSDEEKNDPAIRPGIERFIGKNALVGVLRIKHDVGSGSSLGVLATGYSFVEKHNYVLGADGRFTLNPQTVVAFQLLGTTTRRFFFDASAKRNVYRTGNGLGYSTSLQRSTRHWNLSLTGKGYSPDYRAFVGFTSQTNTNFWDLNVSYNSEPRPAARLTSWTLTTSTRGQFNWQAAMTYAFEAWRSQFNFKKQTYFKADIYSDYQRLFEEEFGAKKRSANNPGAFIGDSERSTIYKGFTIEAGTAPSKKYSASIAIDRSWKAFDYDLGAGSRFPRVSPAALVDADARLDPGIGDTRDMTASLAWQPTNELRFTLNYISSWLRRNDTRRVAFDQKLYSLKTTYQFTRFTFARVRVDYDTLAARVNGQFLVGWVPNPGTAFYIGYNDDLNWNGFNRFNGLYEPGLRRNQRTFFVKLSYLFRRSI
ncbi:MAG TPA: DUF5916 domain-containing protein [Pyrinomonadaceae bacterium]|nr:DUF5916 domain-containing protein [Pyrinomonadaceae bacterium]